MTNLLLARAVLVDWQGVEDEHGAPLPYSRDVALKLITDPDYWLLAAAVAFAAGAERLRPSQRASGKANGSDPALAITAAPTSRIPLGTWACLSPAPARQLADAPVWVRDVPGMPGVLFRVRPFASRMVQRALVTLMREVVKANRRAEPTVEDAERAMALVLARVVLVDWEGMADEHGMALPYRRDIALKLLTDPRNRTFAAAVLGAAERTHDLH